MTNRKIKILHIIKSLGRGGAEMLLPETLNQHDKDQFEFHYIYFLPWKNQVVKEIQDNGGDVKCFPAGNNVTILMKVRQLAAYIRNNKIDLVHCHLPWAGIVGRLAGKMAKVPVVYTEHNKWERYHKLTFAMNKLTFPLQERVIAVSDDVSNSIRTFYKKQNPLIDVVLNGVNTSKFVRQSEYDVDIRAQLNIPAHKKVIGIISVFRVQKRLPEWLDIAEKIHAANPDTYFLIVGDGPLKEELHSKVKDKKMNEYLHFAGLQKEVRPYLKAMDIFMMSSEFEGLPIALLEAMSMETIPACTTAGGIPELVHDGQNGVLVPVEHPLQLADKVLGLLQDSETMKRYSLAARETVDREFGMQQMVRSLEKIYREILN